MNLGSGIIDTVSLLGCQSYDIKKLKAVLFQSFENIGGIEKYIKKGDNVLLKINMVAPKKPQAAATTQPEFVQALSELLIDYGALVTIGDSPGGPFNELAIKAAYHICGIDKAAEACGAKLNYDTGSQDISYPQGKLIKRLTVTNMVLNADKIISVARFKTHGMMRLTGAVKNMFGIIPGAVKAEYHLNRPDIDNFALAMTDICNFAYPVLSFLDGITAMEGNGPTNGTPRNLGFVAAGANPYCVDLVGANIVKAKTSSVPILKAAAKNGYCPETIENIKITGGKPQDFSVDNFKMPNVVNINPLKEKLPASANNLINTRLQPKPVFNHNKCTSCGECLRCCPPKAIHFENKKPCVTLNSCIRCFCCQELCPSDAVDIKRPLLYNILSKI